jgi:hypothetical protein
MTTKILTTSDAFDLDLDPEEAPLTSGVSSVNGQTGAVEFDTDDIDEGDTNLFYTTERAKTDTVVDSTEGVESDKAPSVAAVKSAIAVTYTRDNFTKTADYTMVSTDHIIRADATTAGFTVTLPAAADVTGRQYVIRKLDSTFNMVTVSAAEGIDGSTTRKLATQYETLTVYSNGTTWLIIGRYISPNATIYTPTFSVSLGTVVSPVFSWSRVGNLIYITGRFTAGTATAAAQTFTLPTGLVTADTSLIPAFMLTGFAGRNVASTTYFNAATGVDPSSNLVYLAYQTSTIAVTTKPTTNLLATGNLCSVMVTAPIEGWNL